MPDRKYQQRGRWQRFPPIVPMLRSAGLPTDSQAMASAGNRSRARASLAIAAMLVAAPIRREPSAPHVIASLPGRPRRSTMRSGLTRPSRMATRRSVPPPSACELAPVSSPTAVCVFVGRLYSTGESYRETGARERSGGSGTPDSMPICSHGATTAARRRSHNYMQTSRLHYHWTLPVAVCILLDTECRPRGRLRADRSWRANGIPEG